jgi:hypothetical protein
MKNDLPYFKHYNTIHNEPRMQALLVEHGYEGYGRFWALCEKIASSPNANLDISSKVIKLTVARTLGLNAEEFDNFMSFLSAPDINLIRFENNIITADFLQEDYQRVLKRREGDRNDYYSSTRASSGTSIPLSEMPIPTTENTQIIVNNNTQEYINNSKGQDNKVFSSKKLTTVFMNECKKLGFPVTDNLARSILNTGIETEHLIGQHGFPKYVSDYVNSKYPDSQHTQEERIKLFRSLIKPETGKLAEYREWVKNGFVQSKGATKPEKSTFIPSAEETDLMIDKQKKFREQCGDMDMRCSLSDALKKIVREKNLKETPVGEG